MYMFTFIFYYSKPPMLWMEKHDELLSREAMLVQPFAYRPSTRERGEAWSRIADSLNLIPDPKFYVNQRSVRERFNLLINRFRQKMAEELKATGINPEELTPTEILLEELNVKIMEFESEFTTKTNEQQKKVEAEKAAIVDVRQKALETLSDTQKRKANNGEESTKRIKKSRSTGSETLAYLREKSQKDYEVKLVEAEAHKEEAKAQRMLLEQSQNQQRQQQEFQQQMLQMFQQQQQSMIEMLKKMTKKEE